MLLVARPGAPISSFLAPSSDALCQNGANEAQEQSINDGSGLLRLLGNEAPEVLCLSSRLLAGTLKRMDGNYVLNEVPSSTPRPSMTNQVLVWLPVALA